MMTSAMCCEYRPIADGPPFTHTGLSPWTVETCQSSACNFPSTDANQTIGCHPSHIGYCHQQAHRLIVIV